MIIDEEVHPDIKNGFDKAYGNHLNRSYYDPNTKSLFVAGTDPTDISDLLTDATIPLGMIGLTERYRQADQLIKIYNNFVSVPN